MQSINTRISADQDINEFIESLLQSRRVNAKSLISTFFGDTVLPNDGYAWVQTIFAALELLGVNNRLVRTTLFRLRESGWVNATRSGRRSYYRLTELADAQTCQAEKRIYYHHRQTWDGSWTLVFLVIRSLDTASRRELEQELGWLGFGQVTKDVWARPGGKVELISQKADRLGASGKVIAMRCENIHDVKLGLNIDDRRLASLCSPINEVENIYQKFIDDFSPLLNDQGLLSMQGSNAEMLSLRLLMMDEYRRATLRDPHLPAELLPAKWTGYDAFMLCGKVYKQIYKAANEHYLYLQDNAGALNFNKNFRGLADKPNYTDRFVS